jgi:hypothetical protein
MNKLKFFDKLDVTLRIHHSDILNRELTKLLNFNLCDKLYEELYRELSIEIRDELIEELDDIL